MATILANCIHCSTEFNIIIDELKSGFVTKTYECASCWEYNVFEYRLRSDQVKKHYRDREWLDKKYNSELLTLQQIAELCGCTAMTIRDWMIRHDLETRDPGHRHQK